MINFCAKLDGKAKMRILEASRRAMEQTATVVLRDLVESGIMPFENGYLQNQATSMEILGEDGVRLITDAVYARRKYFGAFEFDQSINPSAGGRWFEPYIGADIWRREFADKIKKGLKRC